MTELANNTAEMKQDSEKGPTNSEPIKSRMWLMLSLVPAASTNSSGVQIDKEIFNFFHL